MDFGNNSSSNENLLAQSPSRENEGQEDWNSSDEPTHKYPKLVRQHRDRAEKLEEILEPILGPENGESCVLLLCCGTPSACRVLPVLIPISTIATDNFGQWSLIKDSWNTFDKSWRHWLPCYGVQQVSLASVSLLAKIGSSGSNRFGDNHSEFPGACTPEDLEGQMQEQQAIIDQVPDRAFPCYYDWEFGFFDHHRECHKRSDASCSDFESYESPYECSAKKIMEAKRRLLQLSRRKLFLTLAFRRPEVTAANDLIPESPFYSHQDVLALCGSWDCPSLYELTFRGLMVEEGWLLSSPSPFFAAISILLMSTTLFRFMFGGWDAAWGAASCLVTIAMFGYQYTKDQPGHRAPWK
ncbi:hypothetical protein NCS52_00127000 [Fusarium sp. LHS14.1]|nr:hypothetical protein NCS52_00127000 [Fusarium sp. LHS14.1]